jgi:glycosyltransferase involved in cell wall biosynthesis
MKILQVCKKFPFPVRDGEVIAVTSLSKSFSKLGAEVTLLAMNTSKHRVDISTIPKNFTDTYKKIIDVPINNDITVIGALKNLFEKESYHVTRFINKRYENALIKILQSENFDIVQIETIFLTQYIPVIRQYSKAKIVLRTHNVEHEIWKRFAEVTDFPPRRWYLNYLNKKLRRFELENLSKCDLLLAITERDLRIFRLLGYRGKAMAIPVGLDKQEYKRPTAESKKNLSVGFIGSLDWMPNQEGLKWFLDNVWNNNNKDIVLHIAGRNAPDWLRQIKQKNVVFHGEVEDAREFMLQHPISLVPLFSGSGIRIKILEAMMLGRTVITTTMGLEGIHAVDGEDVLIANTPYDFQAKLELCLTHPNLVRQIGNNARKLMESDFDNIKISQRVLNEYGNMSKTQKNNSEQTHQKFPAKKNKTE